jgi:hypothetical protein
MSYAYYSLNVVFVGVVAPAPVSTTVPVKRRVNGKVGEHRLTVVRYINVL